MRPSAAQLLAHERLELVAKIADTEKMYVPPSSFPSLPSSSPKYTQAVNREITHKSNILAKERDLHAREAAFAQKESKLQTIPSVKDSEIAILRHSTAETTYASLQAERHTLQSTHHTIVRDAVSNREDELRVLVMRREKEVAAAMARHKEEIMEATNCAY